MPSGDYKVYGVCGHNFNGTDSVEYVRDWLKDRISIDIDEVDEVEDCPKYAGDGDCCLDATTCMRDHSNKGKYCPDLDTFLKKLRPFSAPICHKPKTKTPPMCPNYENFFGGLCNLGGLCEHDPKKYATCVYHVLTKN
jgi:hypothetical protein